MSEQPSRHRSPKWRALSLLAGLAVAAAFYFGSPLIAMRVFGAIVIAYSYAMLTDGRVPYGLEGRPPSGHVSGLPLAVFAVLMGCLGAAMLARPRLLLDLMG